MGRKLSLLPALLAVLALGWVVGWAVSSGKGEISLVAFALSAFFVNRYFAYLEGRGFVLEDERSLRINEVASRRTLQVTMITLAVVMLLLSGRTSEPEVRGAFIAISLTLAGMGLVHLLLRHYYARVM
ncbi:DUF2178 domain-containing protein [Thermococcus gorgonarius]|uniref:DUF2178 domain-containing protein n=1 Tax=Thermococcus gorgonarius TaxID=71997 RepID=A0A2Z2MG19_THEGO|nr:DUF2178 domain-containing protein [Thermococcus gorgonarius]ASJ00888.1 hypothetical protein A3K92_05025 [Thermococcus gorgonarius]